MGTVWKESCQQAQAMIDFMVQNPGDQTLGGLRSIAINVLGKAGYGESQAWSPDFAKSLSDSSNGGDEWSAGGGRVAYFKTIALVTSQFIAAVLIPSVLKRMPFMPQSLQFLGRQMDNVPRYIKEIFKDEIEKQQQQESLGTQGRSTHNSHNVLDMLLQYSDQEKNASGLYLTEEEVSGNLWVFTAAGFDTTANTMGYAVMLLTVYPEYQDWIREELQGLDADVSRWEYQDVFSRCPRILAVMVSFPSLSTSITLIYT